MGTKIRKIVYTYLVGFLLALLASIQVGGVDRKGWGLVIGVSLAISIICVSAHLSSCWILVNYQKIILRIGFKLDGKNKWIFNFTALLYITMQILERMKNSSYNEEGLGLNLIWGGLIVLISLMFVLLNKGYEQMRIALILLLLFSIYIHFTGEAIRLKLFRLEFYGTAILGIEIFLLLFLVLFRFPSNKVEE